MKSIIYILIISFSANAFAFLDVFGKKKVNPLDLKTFDERIAWLLENDKTFQKYWKERKEKLEAEVERARAEMQDIEDEINQRGKYDPKEIKRLKEETERKNKLLFDKRLKEMEEQLLREWTIINGEFVNIKEYEEEQKRKAAKSDELYRVQKFQEEEGIEISPSLERIHINKE